MAINTTTSVDVQTLTPFKRFIMTLGILPTSYLESMTYAELVMWFCNYLQEQVIPAVNNNAEAVQELQNFINNLGIQEEVNNKLDEMAEDGTLEELLGNKAIKKLDYYEITNQTENEVQEIFNIEKAKIISFKNDYTFHQTMLLNANTKILLNNHTLTFDVPSYNEDFTLSHGFFNFKSTDEFTEYDGNGNISIINGTIIGGNLSFCHANNILVENIHFKNCQNNHILEMAAINNLHVNNCIFEGIPVSSNNEVDYLEYIQLDFMEHNDFPWFNENNITYDGTINKNWIIENSNFIKSITTNFTFYNAIGNHNFIQDQYHQNILIKNNTFKNMDNTAIVMFTLENSEISNNKFIRDNYTVPIEGSMITFRYVTNNVTIKNNIFDGNYKAIDCLRLHYNRDNIKIYNNIFKNYIQGTNPIIHLFNIFNTEIYNNIFDTFKNTAIRVDAQVNDGNYNGSYYIYNNKFNTSETLLDNVVKTYIGYPHIYDNIFNCPNPSTMYAIGLPSSSDDTLSMAYAYNNKFENGFITDNHCIIMQGNSPENINDIYFQLYSGNVSSLTNQSPTYDITKFDRLLLVIGGGAGTKSFILTPFTPNGKIDARTYKLSTPGTGDTIIVCKLVINSNGTFNYSTNDSGSLGNIRGLYGYNL